MSKIFIPFYPYDNLQTYRDSICEYVCIGICKVKERENYIKGRKHGLQKGKNGLKEKKKIEKEEIDT